MSEKTWVEFHDEVIAKFHEQHPGVQIARTSTTMEENGAITLRVDGDGPEGAVSTTGVQKPIPEQRKLCGCSKYMGCGVCGKYLDR